MALINKALVLEDDPIASVLIKLTIERSELVEDIEVLSNGKEGFEYIKTLSDSDTYPDVIFLDLNMPFMNGFEFLHALEELPVPKDIPVFVLTSSIDEVDRQKAQTFKSVKGFIVKPLKHYKLKDVENWFKSSSDRLR